MTVKKRAASLELDGGMSRFQVADALEKMVFTAARNWQRTIKIDRTIRDAIVRSLRKVGGVECIPRD